MPALKVLLVDDDPFLGPIVVDWLVVLGHEPTWLDSSERALASLGDDHDFDVLLLDLNLGEQRGETLVEHLRARGATVPPIVVFSGRPLSELNTAAERTGAGAILHKPCDTMTLEHAIAAACAAR